MSRQFSIPTVLRMAPNALLKELFAEMDYARLGRDWEGMGERQIEPVQRAISIQPPEVQIRIETEFRDLFDLACESGIAAICEAADLCGLPSFATRLPPGGLYHKVLWTRLNYLDIFQRALRIHSFDVLNWWRKRNDLPSRSIEVTDALLDQLARELSALFGWTQGRGYPCTVEYQRRGQAVEYFYAHPDDFAQEALCHDDERQLTSITVRPTFNIVFAYNQIEGTLELHAKVPGTLKHQLEQLFAKSSSTRNSGLGSRMRLTIWIGSRIIRFRWLLIPRTAFAFKSAQCAWPAETRAVEVRWRSRMTRTASTTQSTSGSTSGMCRSTRSTLPRLRFASGLRNWMAVSRALKPSM